MTSTAGQIAVRRTPSHSSTSSLQKKEKDVPESAVYFSKDLEENSPGIQQDILFTEKYRAYILAALAAVVLGWWISATVLEATRHRW